MDQILNVLNAEEEVRVEREMERERCTLRQRDIEVGEQRPMAKRPRLGEL